MIIAENHEEFIKKVSDAVIETLNSQKLGEKLLKKMREEKPDMTPEEWEEIKQQFTAFCFCKFLTNTPMAMEEYAGHVWDDLQKN